MEPRNCTEIVKVIRTLLTSAKDGLLTQEIVDDYEQMEGKQMPFKALGYNTIEDLLHATNQFALIETEQGIKVMPKPSKDAYNNKSAPNSPSKGKKKGNMMPPQRALRPTTDNHWNGTAYSQAYTQMPNRSVKKAFTHPAKLLQAAYSNGGGGSGGAYRAILKQSNIKQVPKDETSNTFDEATNWNMQSTMSTQSKPFPMRTQNNQANSGAPPNTWNQRNVYHERINKKPIETAPTKSSSVQSRLAIQKTISTDQVDYAQTPTQQPSFEPYDDTTSNYSNGRMIEKVSKEKDILPNWNDRINFSDVCNFRCGTPESVIHLSTLVIQSSCHSY